MVEVLGAEVNCFIVLLTGCGNRFFTRLVCLLTKVFWVFFKTLFLFIIRYYKFSVLYNSKFKRLQNSKTLLSIKQYIKWKFPNDNGCNIR